MKVGDAARLTRRYAGEDIAAFATLAGVGAKTITHVPEPLIGALFSYLLGVELPGPGTNYLKQELAFLEPPPLDEEVTASVAITRLRPIAYRWKQDGMRDIGLAAEEVEQVEPRLTFRNAKGEVDGVKYNQLSAVFINAFKEQQEQLNRQQGKAASLEQQVSQQQEVIKQQQIQIDALKRVVCKANPDEAMCKP